MKPITCAYCKNNPGVKPNGLWKGFMDTDTKQLVCWQCRHRHYSAKAEKTYSEMPVMALPFQSHLNFNN